MKIILISAKAEHGKDTLAKYLKEKLEAKGEKVIIDHFAKYIKALCYQMGWNGEKDEYWRTALQKLGTETIKGKLNFKCFHAKRLAEDIQILEDVFKVDTFIIPDTRFEDEIYVMKAMFPKETIAVRLVRLGFDSSLTEEQKRHISETNLDNFNFDKVVYTQTGIQHLYDEADRVLKKELDY